METRIERIVADGPENPLHRESRTEFARIAPWIPDRARPRGPHLLVVCRSRLTGEV